MDLDREVPPDSALYAEVVRLYRIAQSLRPRAVERWNGVLRATSADTMGGLNPRTGVLRLSDDRVLRHLTGRVSPTHPRQQVQALATVLHEATHGGMQINAPGEPNAVPTEHSRGVMEGFAEVRTVADVELFADVAGYEGLSAGDPQYPGAFAATTDLMAHVTGPAYTRNDLINDSCRGPAVMHFDQFANAALVNHLPELAHRDPRTQQEIRAQLIQPMLHAHWPTLPNTEGPTGHAVATEIRSSLDAKLDELRRTYQISTPHTDGQRTTPGDRSPSPARPAARADALDNLRFLQAQAAPSGAVGQRPTLGQGSRCHRRPATERQRTSNPPSARTPSPGAPTCPRRRQVVANGSAPPAPSREKVRQMPATIHDSTISFRAVRHDSATAAVGQYVANRDPD
ncbi:hypothetical protein [Kribbella karoonensis]|uniref:Uncharacterized protein n=1 Tax=Kribbella karoonensis TaxID=324851 RepID=A0ABN2EP84_9ACTN